jgi:putative ABC transport system substrate-binding protein
VRRRELITLLGGAAVVWPRMVRAQQAERTRCIGALIPLAESDTEGQTRLAAFRDGLLKLGWTEGRNLRIEHRWATDPDRLRAHAAELVGLTPDVIFAGSSSALAPLHQATRTIPIVFASVPDPVGQGFVASLARPGGNITGFATYEQAIAVKWLELLKEIAPSVVRVIVVYDPANPSSAGYVREIESRAPSFAVQVSVTPVRDADEIEHAVTAFASEPNGGLIVLASPVTATHRKLIISLAAQHRLPAAHPFRYFPLSGGLASYGVDTIDLHRRAAGYVDRILRGERPGELPVQQADKFELVINLKTAKALGIDVPVSLLARTDEVIE